VVLIVACHYMSAPPLKMAPKPRATELPLAPYDDGQDQSSRWHIHESTSPPDALSLVLEQMALINARQDAHARETTALRHRDTLRDAPRVHTQPLVELPPPPQLIRAHTISMEDN
jgi:hypothetical protein